MGVFKRMLGMGMRPSSSRATGAASSANAVYVEKAGLTAFEKDINKLIRSMSNVKMRKEVLDNAGLIVKNKARDLTPKETPRKRDKKLRRETTPVKLRADVEYTYQSSKGSKRKGKGKGIINGKYGHGNLKLSIHVLNDVKKIKAPVSIIGPWVNKYKNLVKPSDKKTNGWYAQIIFGSAEAFGKKITQAALFQTQGRVYNDIASNIGKQLNKATKTTDLIK